MLDEAMIGALHVQALRREDVHAEREPHVLFQASTIGALLDGAYEGDVTVGALAAHGDVGLGTFNALDGEMIVIDGRVYRADVDGGVSEAAPDALTPFAVVVPFVPGATLELDSPLTHAELTAAIDRLASDAAACAVRVDGHFEAVRARSVPRQSPPYRPLGEVVADQHVFEFRDVEGSLVGFRFPDYSEGIEVPGYHLHFISADRARGGHVLEARAVSGTVMVDASAELRVELPAGVDLAAPELSAQAHEALRAAEHDG